MPAKNNSVVRTAIYPGTFDPITNGHLSLVQRATQLFDHIIVAVAMNAGKNPLFSHEERIELVRESLKEINPENPVEVIKFDGLLADLARDLKACAIIRGLRAVSDFEYEFQMALMNRKMAHHVETVFLMPALSWVYLSSTIVKDVASHNGDIHTLVPPVVKAALHKKFNISK
ncbi:MAG: pantetheine-phosphate adenylyltransferase [candidate division Zixibacteria bacterium HGW-Zixibacteria-1]|nr:MAG: pantetheine-phosphate adenylyltransferase [candidate division Zixibacteria bacterium HGW-Zixibacteria-1]